MHINSIFLSYGIFTFMICVKSSYYVDETNLRNSLFSGYDKNIRPTILKDKPTKIELSIYMRYMAGLDELNGILTTVSIISIAWTDEMLNWVPPSNGNITDIIVQKNSVWSPKLVVINPASLVESMGTSAEQTYVLWLGRVVWTFGYVMYTTCDIDVTYFPFDTQECLLELMPIGILSKDMELISNPIYTTFYSENNIWKLESTYAETSYLGPQLYGKYSLKLKRRYTFYILNLFSPVLILAFLNVMVFMIPAESGERVGYAITCLLSLSLYMTFASESLPNSSQPLPIITFVLMAYILISTLISVGTIIGLRFHLHDPSQPPPPILRRLCRLSKITFCRKVKVGEFSDSEKNGDIRRSEVYIDKFSWKDIANKFDKFCFIMSNVFILLLTFLYFYLVVVQSGNAV